MTINFNTHPYYDDYDPKKGFHRILFKPGVSIQARELSQLQTTLQAQIERSGNYFFTEGTNVTGGDFGYTNKFNYVKIKANNGDVHIDDYIEQLLNVDIIGETSGVKARVIAFTKATATDPTTIFVNYTQSNQNIDSDGKAITSTKFVPNENIITEFDDIDGIESGNPILVTMNESDCTGYGQSASIESGVFFVRGHFVYTPSQRIIISKYTNDISCRIGLKINEKIVTSADDKTLLDNAQGSPNFIAMGADRYYLSVNLAHLLDADDKTNEFIEIQRVNNGRQVQSQNESRNLQSKFERTLAQRTSETSGDYVTKPFEVEVRECVNDGSNNGIYEIGTRTDSGNTASEDLLTTQISSGLAYISGFRIESISPTHIDIEKPRDYKESKGEVTTLEMGNYVRIVNSYNTPYTISTTNTVDTFAPVLLFNSNILDRTSSTIKSEVIGLSRIRNVVTDSGTFSSGNDKLDDANLKAFLFDIKMLTKITVSESIAANYIKSGTKITGVNSGATGYVYNSNETSSNNIYLTSVSGKFHIDETLLSSAQNDALTPTIESINPHFFDEVKSLEQENINGERVFSSDVALEDKITLKGTITINDSEKTIIRGFNTEFLSELRYNDIIEIPTGNNGALETFLVKNVISNTQVELHTNKTPSNSVTSVVIKRHRALINDQKNNNTLKRLNRDWIKTLKTDSNLNTSNTILSVRNEFLITSDGDGNIVVPAIRNGKFAGRSNNDYQISVVTAGTDSILSDGDLVNVMSNKITSFSGTDSINSNLRIRSKELFGSGGVIKVIATITKSNVESKDKTPVKGEVLRVYNKSNWSYSDTIDPVSEQGTLEYGTSSQHDKISLGKSDVYKILAVYDSSVSGELPKIPTITIESDSDTNFINGEVVRGSESNAIGTVVNTTDTFLQIVNLNNNNFINGETIKAEDSGETAIINSYTSGSDNITNRFLFDSGQRDNFYDISSIEYKPNASKAIGDILVIYESFESASGTSDFYSIDSYNALDYKTIPHYTTSKIDPSLNKNDGEYDLRSTIDFRPKVANSKNNGTDENGIEYVTESTFDFQSRKFDGRGSSSGGIVKHNSHLTFDVEYYLGKISSIFLTSSGIFTVIDGSSSEAPQRPNDINNAMRIADIAMNPYIIDVSDISIEKFNNKGYSMQDIQLLENRVTDIEYFTTMSLLEKDAEVLQIKDEFGLDRFKSGFLVDNFGGHKIGDTGHQDYRCAIDMSSQTLRPPYHMKPIELMEKALLDDDITSTRESSNYVVKDNIALLPYTHELSISQKYGTRIENVNPVLSFFWEGSLKLSPSQDEWFKETHLPAVTINKEGNYNTLFEDNKNALGTVWDVATTNWFGNPVERKLVGSRVTETGSGRRKVFQREISKTYGSSTQRGITTSLVEQIDYKTIDNKVVGTSLIPYIREKSIYFAASGLKPFTQVYPFFDKIDVSKHTSQTSGSFALKDNAETNGIKAQEQIWESVSSIKVYYDNNSSDNFTIALQTSRTTDAEQGRKVPSDYWKTIESKTINSGRSDNYDVITFNLSSENAITPNKNGEVYIKLLLNPSRRRTFWTNQIQISEIKFFNQDNEEIPNTANAEVYYSRNFIDAHKIVDGSVNVESDKNRNSEAWTSQNKFDATRFWGYQIGIRLTGGTYKVPSSNGNIKINNSKDINSNKLITDGSGRVSGIFMLPDANVLGNPKFQTGEREFRITSSKDNSPNSETFAITNYTATGILKTKQATITATRNARIERQHLSRTSIVSRINDEGLKQVGWYDPIAQSILPQSEGGEFISKIEVFFNQKDGKIPVTCQLRTMQNGTPTTTIIPDAEVTLEPEHVSVSDDATVPTTFEFPHPIYVNPNEEIAIVLVTNSEKYLVWVSHLGEEDISSNEFVSKQPYLGSLFKSQNNSTWTSSDLEDLKFNVYRAKFNTNVVGKVSLVNSELSTDALESNPLYTTKGSTTIKVIHPNHGMYGSLNKVIINGVKSTIISVLTNNISDTDNSITIKNNLPSALKGGIHEFRILNEETGETSFEIIKGTISVNTDNTLSITDVTRGHANTRAISHLSGSVIELYELNGIPLSEINKTHDLLMSDIDYYTINIDTNALETIVMGGSNVTATNNAVVDSFHLALPTIEYPDTSILINKRGKSGTTPNGTQVSYSDTNSISISDSERINCENTELVASSINEKTYCSNSKSLNIDVEISSSKDNLSPIIDLERKSIIAHMNRINKVNADDVYPQSSYNPPTIPYGDSNEAIYITKRVQLKNPATALKVILDSIQNETNNVELMYKTLNNDDAADFDEVSWSYFNESGESDANIIPNDDKSSFTEYEYTKNDLPKFISFAIKIRMVGNNGCEVPLIKNLRAIAIAV